MFLYYIVFLCCFLAIQYIYSCMRVFVLLSQKLSLFTEVFTLTWALDTLSLQRNICQNMHTSGIILSHKNLSHLNILDGNAQEKSLELEFQIPQVLCKSISLWELGPGSSWLNHSHEIHLHICICINIYIYIYIYILI